MRDFYFVCVLFLAQTFKLLKKLVFSANLNTILTVKIQQIFIFAPQNPSVGWVTLSQPFYLFYSWLIYLLLFMDMKDCWLIARTLLIIIYPVVLLLQNNFHISHKFYQSKICFLYFFWIAQHFRKLS